MAGKRRTKAERQRQQQKVKAIYNTRNKGVLGVARAKLKEGQ